MLKLLEKFHHLVAIRIEGMTARCMASGEWECPLVSEALETSGIGTMKEYIQRSNDTVVVQATCRPIYEL